MRTVCGLDVHKDTVNLCILCETGEIFDRVSGPGGKTAGHSGGRGEDVECGLVGYGGRMLADSCMAKGDGGEGDERRIYV